MAICSIVATMFRFNSFNRVPSPFISGRSRIYSLTFCFAALLPGLAHVLFGDELFTGTPACCWHEPHGPMAVQSSTVALLFKDGFGLKN